MTGELKGCDLRFIAARGVEYREHYTRYWKSVTAEVLARCTADDLRRIADTMDPPPTAPAWQETTLDTGEERADG